MLLHWLNLRQPGMVGRYIKDSCAKVRGSFILSHGWMIHAKKNSNKESRIVTWLALPRRFVTAFKVMRFIVQCHVCSKNH